MPHFLQPGQLMADRYRVEKFHAEGGMQEVYLCHDITLDRVVALKVPKQGVKDRRFRRGAEMGARVNHPNIAATFDYYEDDRVTFLVEEFVDGLDLGQQLKHSFQRMDPHLASHVLHHIARGLMEAHRMDICHRDLKPSNVMVSVDMGIRGVKLTDFGIAKLAENELEAEMSEFNNDPNTLTTSNTLLGAVPYMAPECWDDWRSAGQPMDVWALGCVAYHLLVGEPPFGLGRQAIANVVRYQAGKFELKKPDWFGAHANTKQLEDNLWILISDCLAADPTERPTSAEVVGRCDGMCYADVDRFSGEIEQYPGTYPNGSKGNFGFILGENGRRLFFHKSDYYGLGAPMVGQKVAYAVYPGVPRPRVCPVLCLRDPK